jgi:pimeloyl-ACP methyl ester carboxylesterase
METAVALDLSFEAVGDGPPLVVLHGLLGSKTNWRSVARALAPTHRVYSVDARNHGSSPWADAMSYPDMANDLLRFMEQQGVERPVVLGHSMGGKIAMTLGLLHPQVVERLIVVDIAPVVYDDRLSPVAEAMRAVDVLHVASREEVRQRLRTLLPDAGLVGFMLQNLEVRNAHFDWRVNLGAILASVPLLSGFPSELLGLSFARPVHVIAGGRSDYVRGSDGADFHPMFERVDVQVIEQVGHWVHAERPIEFLAAVKHALAKPARTTGGER